MNVHLDADTERFVQEKIQAGQYHSPAELIRYAIELLQIQERLDDTDISDLRSQLRVGLEQLDRGEGEDWDVEQMKQTLRDEAARIKRAS